MGVNIGVMAITRIYSTWVIGVSGAKIHLGAVELKGIVLATIVGIAMSLIFRVVTLLRGEERILEPDEDTTS